MAIDNSSHWVEKLNALMHDLAREEKPGQIWVDLVTREVWKIDRFVDTATGEVTDPYFVYRRGEWLIEEPPFAGLGFDPRTGYPVDRGSRGESDDEGTN